ncbi:MAG: hypothetical protein IPJ69_04065 [Deltaproteobacteria bacterium]|nr:MAG: hypothetical protein IPJ69_04065 [Deltaproteobacteria bacterium]
MESLFDNISKALSYPKSDFKQVAESVHQSLSIEFPELAPKVLPYLILTQEVSLHRLEEMYTNTFDVQAPCYLEVGYVLFGEDYKRGHFLVKMQELQALIGHDCGSELPDHLPNVIQLILHYPHKDQLPDFLGKLVLPALSKMLRTLPQEHFYHGLLDVTFELLKEVYPLSLDHYTPSLDLPTLPTVKSEHEERGLYD